ncbi:MAG: GvpL/GvpF family gas vesicle protein, partial [Bacteroidales bacterium]
EKLNTLLLGIKGIADVGLSAVRQDGIAAVIGENNKSDLISDKANAIQFAGIIEKLAQNVTLLPMRYGSFMESSDAVALMLERNCEEIGQNLRKVEGKYEFGLKVFCGSEKLKANIVQKNETGTESLQNAVNEVKNSVFREYINAKLKAHRLEELVISYVDSVITAINAQLAMLQAEHKFKKMASASILIDSIFLLEKGKKIELVEAIKTLQNHYPDLDFVLTGPWPPYSFVETTIK